MPLEILHRRHPCRTRNEVPMDFKLANQKRFPNAIESTEVRMVSASPRGTGMTQFQPEVCILQVRSFRLSAFYMSFVCSSDFRWASPARSLLQRLHFFPFRFLSFDLDLFCPVLLPSLTMYHRVGHQND